MVIDCYKWLYMYSFEWLGYRLVMRGSVWVFMVICHFTVVIYGYLSF